MKKWREKLVPRGVTLSGPLSYNGDWHYIRECRSFLKKGDWDRSAAGTPRIRDVARFYTLDVAHGPPSWHAAASRLVEIPQELVEGSYSVPKFYF